MSEGKVLGSPAHLNFFPSLEFTGNWFVDAGIMGFVNLMEEVYGWDLDELQRRIKESPEKIYFWYFIFGYIFKSSILNRFHKHEAVVKKEIADRERRINELLMDMEDATDKKDTKKCDEIKRKIENLKKDISELENELKNSENKLMQIKELFISKVNYFLSSNAIDCNLLSPECIIDIEKNIPEFGVNFIKHNRRLVLFTQNKNSQMYLFKMLPNHPNERNFYLFNSDLKNNKGLVFLYLHSLLKEEWDVIKLIRAFKANEREFIKFINFCLKNKLQPLELIRIVEMGIMDSKRKRDILKDILTMYNIPESDKKTFENFIYKIFTNFKSEINRKGSILSFEIFPDSTINPFLYSPSQFPNAGYVNLHSIEEFKSLLPDIPIYLLFLCFFDAFVIVRGRNILFYTHNISISYEINRRIKFMKKIASYNNKNNINILTITWNAILDYMLEKKASFNLEDMYLIEVDFEQQKLKNVDYVGLSKIKSNLILDESIRININLRIPTPTTDKNKKRICVWLLEEFIKNKSLLPYIINYVHGLISEQWMGSEKEVNRYTLLTVLAVDAEIKEMNRENVYGGTLFDENYFSKYGDVVTDTKRNISSMYYYGRLLYSIADNKNNRDKLATLLFSKIKSRDKYGFVNTLLKNTIGKEDTKKLVSYLFDRILHNDVSWENYALALVIGLIKRGDESG